MAQWQHKPYAMKIAIDAAVGDSVNLLDLLNSRLLDSGFSFSGLTVMTWPEFDKFGTTVRFSRGVRSGQAIPTVDVFVGDDDLVDGLNEVIDALVEAVFKLYPEYQQEQVAVFIDVEQAQAWMEENSIEW